MLYADDCQVSDPAMQEAGKAGLRRAVEYFSAAFRMQENVATKWALAGLGGALRKEVGNSGVRISLIEPGIVDTPLVRNTVDGAAELASRQSLNPEDVARAIMFVLEQPAHVNTNELMISPLAQPH